MKPLLALFLVLCVVSCDAIPKKERELVRQKYMTEILENQNFTVEFPDSWIQVLIDEDVNYSPKELKKQYYNYRLYLTQLYPKNTPALAEYAETLIYENFKLSLEEI